MIDLDRIGLGCEFCGEKAVAIVRPGDHLLCATHKDLAELDDGETMEVVA